MFREAAVAVIRRISPHCAAEPRLEPHAEPHYLILRRADNPQDPWSGHYAFPGGRREPQDASLLHTCLRETREECGLHLPLSALVRALPVTEAGQTHGRPIPVTPYLFELTETASPLELVLEPLECASFHWVSASYLQNPLHHTRITPIPGSPLDFPAIRLEGGHIWGFTYKVLAGLLEVPRP